MICLMTVILYKINQVGINNMKNLNNYITERLHITKNSKANDNLTFKDIFGDIDISKYKWNGISTYLLDIYIKETNEFGENIYDFVYKTKSNISPEDQLKQLKIFYKATYPEWKRNQKNKAHDVEDQIKSMLKLIDNCKSLDEIYSTVSDFIGQGFFDFIHWCIQNSNKD